MATKRHRLRMMALANLALLSTVAVETTLLVQEHHAEAVAWHRPDPAVERAADVDELIGKLSTGRRSLYSALPEADVKAIGDASDAKVREDVSSMMVELRRMLQGTDDGTAQHRRTPDR